MKLLQSGLPQKNLSNFSKADFHKLLGELTEKALSNEVFILSKFSQRSEICTILYFRKHTHTHKQTFITSENLRPNFQKIWGSFQKIQE